MRICAVLALVLVSWMTASCRVQHCEKFEVEGSHLGGGVVHLVYSMKRKCVLCYKEVNKLLTLKSRMAKFGHKMDVSVAMNKSPTTNHRKRLPPELIVDVEEYWKRLGKKNGHIFVFDKCGKLAYQVITPWSKQNYPFTGMAALSAILDDPCGECNVTMKANPNPTTDKPIHPEDANHHKLSSSGEEYEMPLRESKIPLTIIYRSRHDHTEGGKKVTYNVVELRSNDPTFHGHAEKGKMNLFNVSAVRIASKIGKENEKADLTIQPEQETTVPPMEYYDDYSDEDESSSSEKPMDQKEVQELKSHYELITKWMSCAQQIMNT